VAGRSRRTHHRRAIIYGRPARSRRHSTSAQAVSRATAKPERIEFSFGIQAFTDTFLYANARLQRDGRNDILNCR
jgi:hypothetical protein